MKMPGITELVLILAVALIIFGPRKLPEIGRSIGRGIREFRSATTEVKKSVSLDEEEEESSSKELKKQETKAVDTGEDLTVKDSAEENENSDKEEQEEASKEEQKV